MFNPKFKDFMEENKNITLIGVGWAAWWRLYVVVLGIIFAVYFFAEIVD